MKTITTSEVTRMYQWAKGSLYQAYKTPSVAKQAIWADIQQEVINNGGRALTVRSRNCMIFTAMYKVARGNKDYLVVIYPTRREIYEII